MISSHIVRSLGSVESHRLCSITDCTVFLLCDPREVKSFELRDGICKVGVMTYRMDSLGGLDARMRYSSPDTLQEPVNVKTVMSPSLFSNVLRERKGLETRRNVVNCKEPTCHMNPGFLSMVLRGENRPPCRPHLRRDPRKNPERPQKERRAPNSQRCAGA